MALVAATAAIALVSSPLAQAQTEARLAGRVTDEQGNPIEGALIEITSVDRGETWELTTDGDGEYLRRGLRIEVVRIRVTADGYVPQEQDVKLNFGVNTVDVVMPSAQRAASEELAEAIGDSASRANTAYQNRDFEGAIAAAEEFLAALQEMPAEETVSERAQGHQIIGQSLVNLGRHDEAIEQLERAIELQPEEANAHAWLGQAYAGKEDLETASEHFQRALELDPNDPGSAFNVGVILLQGGQLEAGIEALERAVELRPDFHQAYNQLGLAYARTDEYAKAVEAFERYLELQPEAPDREQMQQFIDALRAQIEQ